MVTAGPSERRRENDGRLLALRIGFAICFGLLVLGFWTLQIVQHGAYEERAANNHLKTIPLRAPRGVVFDRYGRVLVENRYSFTVAIQRELTKDLDATIRRLASVARVDEAAIHEAVEKRRREPLFRPLAVIEHATFDQVAALSAHQIELPEIVIQEVPTRAYPADRMAAHLFGYVGEIQDAQLASREFSALPLQPGAVVGQSGLERVYNARLMGTDGNRFVVVNNVGRETDELTREDPVDGARMQTTIDYDVQRALEDGFAALGFAGGGAVLDPNTGEVLAMASLPAYDPNVFAVGIGGSEWKRLLTDPLRPMTNRLIQGTYSPGSTFKIVMAVAGLEEGVITPETTFYCPGHGTFYGRSFKCNRPAGHGMVDLARALEQSCNVYFYNIGARLSIDTIHDYAAKLGLVGKTGIDLPSEGESLVGSTAWKQRTQKERWYPSETISVAIGQGVVSVTPMALATMIATVANGGTLVTPHLARAFDVGDGKGWQPVPVPPAKARVDLSPEHLHAVRDGLWRVVNAQGTGGKAKIEGRDVSGKTGTAQVVGLQNKAAAAAKMDVRDHGWFVFFAPRDNPQIAGVIFAEHGLHGSSAAPIAKHVMETFFAKQDGTPLPPSPLEAARLAAAPPASVAPNPTRAAQGPVGLPTAVAAPPAAARPASPRSGGDD
jgi:penicillin-binding protein 2